MRIGVQSVSVCKLPEISDRFRGGLRFRVLLKRLISSYGKWFFAHIVPPCVVGKRVAVAWAKEIQLNK